MSFKLGDIIVKDILYGYASDLTPQANPLYVLTQLSEANINITAESVDVTDKNGNIVKKVYRSKSGEFTATNAFINANILEAASGRKAEFATSGDKIQMPKIMQVKASTNPVTIADYVAGTVKVNMFYGDGTLGKAYALGSVASETEFAIDSSSAELTLPTDPEAELFIIRYTREVEEGAVIRNTADEFPSSVNMLLKVAYYDPCSKDSIKACYIEMPSFQVSPETSVSLSADSATMDFSGTLELDYCAGDKVLYNIYLVDDED